MDGPVLQKRCRAAPAVTNALLEAVSLFLTNVAESALAMDDVDGTRRVASTKPSQH